MTELNDLRVAVDIGGTFTDTVLINGSGRILATAKTPTTPSNPAEGAMDGVCHVLQTSGATWSQITGFIHGTTLATNALIERRGARVSTITTAGFRDILEIAYERRYSQYDINIEKPDLLVPRARSLTISGRISAKGDELAPLGEAEIPALVEQLKSANTEAIAICLIHSYAAPEHERRLKAELQAHLPEVSISISSDVSPEAREFDRLCTTIANAYIQPLMAQYLTDFDQMFADAGLTCPILMMTAGGGMTTLETAAALPIRLVESGPAGGAILAAHIAHLAGAEEVLSFDMGGTTAKLCLIDQYKPQTARRFEIARAERFIKGSGMPVRIPVLEMIEIGAGGGSIAGIDRLGRIQVGPQSAGSEPGPAAFGKGGTWATVTDADVQQGLIEPASFAEGRLKLECEKAALAINACFEALPDLSTDAAAAGISEIVDESMASAGRMHAVESGKDLSARVMIAFGGNGPLHATRVARRAGVSRILIPNDPGVGSAVGFLYAPVSFEIVRSRYARLDDLDIDQLNQFLGDMIAEATEVVRAGDATGALHIRRSAFMRYHGQGHEIEITMPDRALKGDDLSHLRRLFENEYTAQFARAVPGMAIEILNWSVTATAGDTKVVSVHNTADQGEARPQRQQSILCEVSQQRRDVPVFERMKLRPGHALSGPALIVEPQTTTYVSADFDARVASDGVILLTKQGERS